MNQVAFTSADLPALGRGKELFPSLKETLRIPSQRRLCSIVKDAKRIGQCAMLHVGSFADLREFTKVETCVITGDPEILMRSEFNRAVDWRTDSGDSWGKRLLYVNLQYFYVW